MPGPGRRNGRPAAGPADWRTGGLADWNIIHPSRPAHFPFATVRPYRPDHPASGAVRRSVRPVRPVPPRIYRHTGRPAAPSVHDCIGSPAPTNQSAKRTPKRCPNDLPAPKKRLLDWAERSVRFLWGRLPSGMTAGQLISAPDRSGTLTFCGYEYHPWNIVEHAHIRKVLYTGLPAACGW